MNMPPIVSPQEWKAAREQLLVKEKELTHARDALAAERRRMPRMAVEKEYAFEGPNGPGEPARRVRGAPPADRLPLLLRARRRRLARERLPRLLLDRRPGHPPRPSERPRHHDRVRLARPAGRHRALEGADGLGGHPVVHADRRLRRRLRRRPSGTAPTSSSRDDDRIFRTYFVDGRGDEALGGLWAYLDITALGRQEEWEDSPEGYPQSPPNGWIRRHDEYDVPAEIGGGQRERHGRADRALPRGARPLGELELSAGAAAHRSSTTSSRGCEQQISALPVGGGFDRVGAVVERRRR